MKNFPFFMLVRIKRYFIFLTKHSPSLFISAMKGYIKGVIEIPKSFRKRKEIQDSRKVSIKYLESILK
jgi:hypothetical protein